MASTDNETPRASLLVPCYNEQESLPLLLAQVREKFSAMFGNDWELVLVDDGSADDTANIIRRAAAEDRRIRGVLLSRNFGHQPALAAGLGYCRGRAVGIIDCDLQDPIDILVELFKKVEQEGFDIAYGVRAKRDAPWVLRFAYKTFYKLIHMAAEHHWPEDAGDFCVMTRRCVDVINQLPEHVRMLRGMRSWIGFRQIGVPYERPRRIAGATHYGFGRLSRLALDAVVGFSTAPLRLASMFGFVAGIGSLVLAVIFVLNRFFPGLFPFGYYIGANPGIATLAILVSVLSSIILICMGILGEYIAILLREVKARPTAVVADVVNGPKQTN